MIRAIIAEYMLQGGAARVARLRAEYRANAANYQATLAHVFAEDLLDGLGDDLTFALSCFKLGSQFFLGVFPTDNGMAPQDYAAAFKIGMAQIQAAGMQFMGGRMTWRIASITPCGLALGLETPGSISQAQLLAECGEMATRFGEMLPDGATATFPIFQPGSAWGDGSAAFSQELRTTARYILGDRCWLGQLAYPDGYEAGSALLASPPCFAQLQAGEAPEPARTDAAAMGLMLLEEHQGPGQGGVP
jgi:hypothetical protein